MGSFLRKIRVLVAPLDWGLGHTTRCIPLVNALLQEGCEVFLAGNQVQEQLFAESFPGLSFLPLTGYQVRYARTKLGLTKAILTQVPKIKRAIRDEHRWLQEQVKKHQFDLVISDNRYGLYHDKIPCIFITHQLTIKTGWGKWSERWLQRRAYRYINRFKECWVPDLQGEDNLAGELSHPAKKPNVPVKYLGILSRFSRQPASEKPGHLLILLSGPEPQRTILENKIVDEIAHYAGTATVVRGLPAATSFIPSTNDIRFYNHLPTAELAEAIQTAQYVIARSGYTTVMDMVTLEKKSILIPAPGQTEQEYLAKYLQKNGIAWSTTQKDFSLEKAIQEVRSFSFALGIIDANEGRKTYEEIIQKLIVGFTKQG